MNLADDPADRSEPPRQEATQALRLAADGDREAGHAFTTLLYHDLRRMADGLLRRERDNHTLQPTALVHEAWMRLVDESALDDGLDAARRRFLACAAQSMRRILIDHARHRGRLKRVLAKAQAPLTDVALPVSDDPTELLDLDQALHRLADLQPRAARIAELRIYGGLSTAEAGQVEEVSLATAKADWALAQAYLSKQIRGEG